MATGFFRVLKSLLAGDGLVLLMVGIILFGINSVLMRRMKKSLIYAGVAFVGYLVCELCLYVYFAGINYRQEYGIVLCVGQVLVGAAIGFVLGAIITKKIGEKVSEVNRTIIIKKAVLRVIAFAMFMVAVMFVIAAFSCPTLTFPDIGPFKPEAWMLWVFYILYVIVMSAIFIASFFIKEKKKLN